MKNPVIKITQMDELQDNEKKYMEISFENGLSKSSMEDMIVSQYQYSGSQMSKFNQMALELDKYEKVENGYLRTDILGDVSEVFSDKRIYAIHYIEALGPI